MTSTSDCPSRRFGNNCEKECHCRDPTESCDSILGICESGCAEGWDGYDCQERKYTGHNIHNNFHIAYICEYLVC